MNKKDENGSWGITLGLMAIGGLIGAVTNAVATVVTSVVAHEKINLGSVIVSAGAGFISGALATSPLGKIGQIVANGIIGGVEYLVDCEVTGEEVNPIDASAAVLTGMLAGRLGGKGANGAKIKGVASTAKQYLKTAVSPQKIAMYTEKLCGAHKKSIIGD